MQVFDRARRAKLIEAVHKQFGDQGWKVEAFGWQSCDVSVRKKSAHILIECVDGSVLEFMAGERVFAHLQEQSGVSFRFGCPVLAVLDDGFQSFGLDNLVSRGIPVALIQDITTITRLDRFLTELPSTETTALELLLAARSPTLSLALSDSFKVAGNQEQAVAWARKAVAAGPKMILGYVRLGQLLQADRYLAGEDPTMRDGLRLFPDSLPLLTIMRSLATQRGDPAEADHLAGEIAMLKDKRSGSIGVLLRAPPDAQPPTASAGTSTLVSARASFFHRLFKHSGKE